MSAGNVVRQSWSCLASSSALLMVQPGFVIDRSTLGEPHGVKETEPVKLTGNVVQRRVSTIEYLAKVDLSPIIIHDAFRLLVV